MYGSATGSADEADSLHLVGPNAPLLQQAAQTSDFRLRALSCLLLSQSKSAFCLDGLLGAAPAPVLAVLCECPWLFK